MKIDALSPSMKKKVQFDLSQRGGVPETPGVYALTNFDGLVLYVGKATSTRDRMMAHLDDPEKTCATPFGKVVWFYFVTCITADEAGRIESGWLNISILSDGALPPMNRSHT